MSGIRSKNTKPEILIRKKLHSKGYRYRIHVKKLPGNPDIVMPKWNLAIFVHGCFWHLHDCENFKWPKTNSQYWRDKIQKNFDRDQNAIESLLKMGWRVLVVWECSFKKKKKFFMEPVLEVVEEFISSKDEYLEIPDKNSITSQLEST